MSNLTVKQNEDGKYGFVDDAGNWVIEPKLLKAFVWNELGVVHFEEKNEDGQTYDGWTIFKLDNPSEYNGRTDDTGMGGDYGWYDHMNEPEDDDAEYIEAWNGCGDSFRIYPDGEILYDDEFEDEEDEDWEEDD
ncbi:MAG: hypothetical protein HDS46_06555 [Bacteroides sp.]|nr:hypothetical protein [Bacteroides sp.]